jgi:predicted RNA-binding protein associated with RNAse of E/G family
VKRKTFDLRPWVRVTQSTQTALAVPGYVIVDFTAQTVIRPLEVTRPGTTVRHLILDNGYRWIRCHPTGTGDGVMGAALTVQLNAAGQPVQFYVDIHGGEGVHEDGLPWHDDLYLDVVGNPDDGDRWTVAATEIIDADELEEAVEAGLVTPELAARTWDLARQIEVHLRAGTYPPVGVLRHYVEDPYT